MMKHNNTIIAVILFMMVGAFARLIPHMPNFTPVESLTIFGAAYLSKKHWAFILSVFVMYVSDFIINNTIARSFFPDVEGIVWFSNYMLYNFVAMALIVLVSSRIITKVNIKNVGVSVLMASIIFFIITNFGSWAGDKSLYSNDLNGLMASFTAGIPFFRNSLLSNIVFTTVIFGSFEIYTSIAAKQKTTAGI
jgi:hypothetical protein